MPHAQAEGRPAGLDARQICLHDLLAVRAKRSPDALAIVRRGHQLTYGELDRRVEGMARRLTALGAGPEVPVGVCVERSPELVIALLAILAAGGAYVPLDPNYPRERLVFMLRDAARACERPVLVTQRGLLARLGDLSDLAPALLLLDESSSAAPSSLAGPAAPRRAAGPENLAYVIYTSGSTGTPKGVAVEHHSAVALVRWAQRLLSAEELSGVLFSTSICFDIHVFELFVTLAAGGTVVLAENALELPALPESERVTLLHTVPSAMAELLRLDAVPRSVRTVGLGGETLTGVLADQVYARTAARRLLNFYGPTEDTVWSTCAEVPRQRDREPAIGRPAGQGSAHLLDGQLQPVPPGTPGEVYLGGEGVARGYLHRPALTAERFVPDPFGGGGGRLYRVGDLARHGPDGQLEFLGRVDNQVKLRGFRIEIGEIEACLARHPALRESVVAAPKAGAGGVRLVAYLVAEREPAPMVGELRQFLEERLPAYMVPAAFVFLPALPRLANGKVDRGALPPPGRERPRLAVPYAPPRTKAERVIEEIWAAQLGLDQIGLHDPLLELGADSLAVMRLASRIGERLGIELSMLDLFAHPTLAQLAGYVAAAKAVATAGGPERLAAPPREEIPLALPQEQVWFMCQVNPANLAYHFQCTLRFRGPLDRAALERSLTAIVERHEIYRTTFPAVDGRPVQRIHPPFPVQLRLLDCRGPGGEPAAKAERRIARELWQPIDVARLPLVRWVLLRLGPQEHLLLHVEHHLLHDGWSFHVFLRELLEHYRALVAAQPVSLPPPAIQFADFARWQQSWLRGAAAQRQLEFWIEQLRGAAANLELPTDRPRPRVPSFRGAAPRFALSPGLCGSLRELARRQGATFFMAQLTAFVVLMSRYSGQLDLTVGTGVANRRWRNTEGLLGMLVNVVALRTELGGDPPLRGLLDRVRAVALAAYAHQDLPLESVVSALRLPRDPGRNPLFQVLFNFHDAPLPAVPLPGLSVEVKTAISNRSAKFDLNVILIPRLERPLDDPEPPEGDGATLIWEYSSDVFDAPTMARMAGHFRCLLAALAADPDQRLADVPMLAEEDRHQVQREWSPGWRVYVLDAALRPAAVGCSGQIAMAGADLGPGSLLDPALTAERFRPDPFAERPGERLYLSGDRGRWSARGRLELLGRLEGQVEAHGPRTGALPETGAPEPRAAPLAPCNKLEAAVCEVWQEVLGLDRVGADDDFFALGGYSLLAVRLLHRVHQRFGVEVPLARLLTEPTPAALARHLDGAAVAGGPRPAALVQPRAWAGDLPGGVADLAQDEVDRMIADLLAERREGRW
jgi:amino acid adenylation domain-containing protein